MNIKKILHRFRAGSSLRNMTVVMSGTVGAQAIGFLLMPVISRLYTSADYGVYGAFMSVLGVVGAIATLQYNQAVVLPKKDDDSFNLLIVSCVCALGVAVGSGLLLILSPWLSEQLIKLPSRWVGVVFGLVVLANGLHLAFQAWCIRVKAFHRTSLSHVIRSLASTSIWVLLGFWGAGTWGLIAGSVIGALLSLVNLYGVVRHHARQLTGYGSLPRIKELAFEYRDFPYYSAPQNMMNALSQGLPVLLLAYFYDVRVAGAYAFGNKMLGVPLNIIREALRQVLFQRASEIHNNQGNLQQLFLKTTGGLFAIVLIPAAIMMVWAPQLFALVFGAEWQVAGEYARWLILWHAVAFCNVPAVLFARILRQQRNLLLYEILVLLSRTSILIITGVLTVAFNAVVSFSVLGSLLNAFLILWVGIAVFKQKYPEIAAAKMHC